MSSRARSLLVSGILLASCSAPAEPSRAPDEPRAEPAPSPAVDAATAELVAAARKRMAADEALVANSPGVLLALKKQERQRTDARMNTRVPRGPAADDPMSDKIGVELMADIRAAADEAGVLINGPKVVSHTAARPVPAEHRGDGPYEYGIDQLFEAIGFEVELPAGDAAAVRRLIEALDRKDRPVPFVRELRPIAGGIVLDATWLRQVDVKPPRHVVPPLTLGELAIAANVPIPDRAPPEVAAILEQHAALEPKIDVALEVLGQSHLEAARYRFYSQYGAATDKALGGGRRP